MISCRLGYICLEYDVTSRYDEAYKYEGSYSDSLFLLTVHTSSAQFLATSQNPPLLPPLFSLLHRLTHCTYFLRCH